MSNAPTVTRSLVRTASRASELTSSVTVSSISFSPPVDFTSRGVAVGDQTNPQPTTIQAPSTTWPEQIYNAQAQELAEAMAADEQDAAANAA